jgi:hypothetical protein
VFDSNTILLYLAEKTGQFLPEKTPAAHAELLSWMMFIATGIGPYSGQAVRFRHFAPKGLDYAVDRYLYEARRHYGILDAELGKAPYVFGSNYTIADMSAWVPYCNMQLSDLHLVEPRLRMSGFEIVFLSTDRLEILYSSLKAADTLTRCSPIATSRRPGRFTWHITWTMRPLRSRSNTTSISTTRPAPLCTSYRYPRTSSSTRRVPYATSTRIPIIRSGSPPMLF